MLRNIVINLLFRLLGNSHEQLHSIGYLFGATTSTHESRKNRWEKALVRLWQDKDLLDFLYYQAESDKEVFFKGKVGGELSKGARIRTLFIVYSAHRAYKQLRKKKKSPSEIDSINQDIKKVGDVYNKLVDIE